MSAHVGDMIQWSEEALWDEVFGEEYERVLVAKRGGVGHIISEDIQPDGTKTYTIFFERTARVHTCMRDEFQVLCNAQGVPVPKQWPPTIG